MKSYKINPFEKISQKFLNAIVKNVRFGFATNSSSSHSMVYMKKPVHGAENLDVSDWRDAESGDSWSSGFHWEDFRLDTPGTKMFYALVQKIGGTDFEDGDIAYVVEEYGKDFPEFVSHLDVAEIFSSAAKSSIDHESVGILSPEEARDPNVVVFGGNDNDGDSIERQRAFDDIDWNRTSPTWNERTQVDRLKKSELEASEKPKKASSAGVSSRKYHISPKTGNPNLCHAQKRSCPLGESVEHYSTKDEARDAFEKMKAPLRSGISKKK